MAGRSSSRKGEEETSTKTSSSRFFNKLVPKAASKIPPAALV